MSSLADDDAAQPAGFQPKSLRPDRPAERVHVRIPTILWISYLSAVCGCIAAVSLSGIHRLSVNSISAISSRMSILTVTPVSSYAGTAFFREGELLALIFCFGLGSFVSGLVLAVRSDDGSVSFMKLEFPSYASWHWRHQLLITICIVCLSLAHAIVQSESDKIPSYVSGALPKSGAFVFSVLLLSFTSSILSTILTLHHHLLLRAANHTSTLYDIFWGLGFALRARSCRYLWKAQLLFCTVAGFVAGACIGANAYMATLKFSAVIVPIIMLAPLWIAGLAVIVAQRVTPQLRSAASLAVAKPPPAAHDFVPKARRVSVFVSSGSNHGDVSYRKLYAWAFFNSFVGGVINAITIQGIFQRSSTHTTSMLTRMAIGLQYPPAKGSKGGASLSSEDFALALISFNLPAFISGFVMTTRANHVSGGRLYPLQMNYPTSSHWRWRHQLLLTFCIASLAACHAIVRFQNGGNQNFISTINVTNSSSMFWAWILATFASGFLNAMLAGGSLIVLRAGNMSGTVMDAFLGLAFTLRSRSLVHMWRVLLLSCTYTAFYIGGIAGSLVFQSSFGASVMIFPAILLAPVWLLGIVLLWFRYRNVEGGALNHVASFNDEDIARGTYAQIDAKYFVPKVQPHASISQLHEVSGVSFVEMGELRETL